ncbi:MAG: Fur family transcriptional regulator, partial [Myxococcota bacterium]
TPEILFGKVREQMPTLSLATVYKAIETFKDMGVIREIRVPDDHRMRLDADVSPHHHMVCRRCHVVLDLRADIFREITVPTEQLQGFRVQGYSLQLTGLCSKCAADEE